MELLISSVSSTKTRDTTMDFRVDTKAADIAVADTSSNNVAVRTVSSGGVLIDSAVC